MLIINIGSYPGSGYNNEKPCKVFCRAFLFGLLGICPPGTSKQAISYINRNIKLAHSLHNL